MHYPDFIDNGSFYHLDRSKSDLEQLVALAENLKRVHLLTAKHYESFETLINDYLHSGIEIFQMQTGIVSHITEDKKYIVKDVVTDLEVIQPGDEYELEGTYCKEVYASQETIGFPHVAEISELKEHPVYVNLKLEAYLSAPIFVREELYGTLNFTSLIPREHGFSEHEHDLISMMATAIGNFILLREKEEKLKKLNRRMKELIGYVAHDLRNPLGTINSLSHILLSREMPREKTEQIFTGVREESERALELVNTILDQAALGTGKISLKESNFELQSFVNRALETLSVLSEEKGLKVKLSSDDTLRAYGDKARLNQVLHNLLINAFKYALSNSEVEIEFFKEGERIQCRISNIQGDEKSSLDESVYKSVGYGLNIVEDILSLHNTRLKVTQKGSLYQVSFDLACAKEQ